MCYLNVVGYFTILRVEIKKSPVYVGLLTNWRLLLARYYLEDEVDAVGGGACLSYLTGFPK